MRYRIVISWIENAWKVKPFFSSSKVKHYSNSTRMAIVPVCWLDKSKLEQKPFENFELIFVCSLIVLRVHLITSVHCRRDFVVVFVVVVICVPWITVYAFNRFGLFLMVWWFLSLSIHQTKQSHGSHGSHMLFTLYSIASCYSVLLQSRCCEQKVKKNYFLFRRERNMVQRATEMDTLYAAR